MNKNIFALIMALSLLFSCGKDDTAFQPEKKVNKEKEAPKEEFMDNGQRGCVTGNCREGEGLYVWDNGARYTGTFKTGKPHGQGTYIWPGGKDKYTGEFRSGRRYGVGTMIWGDKNLKYEGHWKNDKMHGEGMETAPGWTFIGQYEYGKKDGIGSYFWPNQDRLIVNLKKDRETFSGIMTYHDGSKYQGTFKMLSLGEAEAMEKGITAVYDGEGTLTIPKVSIYTGQWKNGKMHGQGTLTMKDGTVKKGAWVNGEYAGK